MRGTSAASLEAVSTEASTALRSEDVSRERIAEELFQVADVIDGSNQLVRLLSDAGQDATVKEAAAGQLFDGKVSEVSTEILRSIVSRAWSEQDDILDALEHVGVVALFDQADAEGKLADVEEELFQLSRLVDGVPALSEGLDGAREHPERRVQIIGDLLEGNGDRLTSVLARRAVGRRTEEKPSRRILQFAELAAQQRSRLLAVVSSARPLSEQQQDRLASILAGIYGREVQMTSEIDEDVVGGLRIKVGDDLYDATVLSRLASARERLVS